MTNIIGSNEIQNDTDNVAVTVQRPEVQGASEVLVTPGQETQLNFDLSEVAAMTMNPDGALVIKFDDGATLTLSNFSDLARQGAQTNVKFSDGTDLDFAGLYASLTGQPLGQTEGVIAVLKPVGTIGETELVFDLAAGNEYIIDFNVEEIAGVANENGNLIITFVDGTRTVLENFDAASASDLPPAMTLADGSVVEVANLLTALGGIGATEMADSGEDLQTVEPAAGTESAAQPASQPAPQELAALEPAAGTEAVAPAAQGAQEGTTNFDSSIDPQGIGGLDAVGPIGVTALQFDLPEFDDPLLDADPAVAAAAAPTPAAPPQLQVSNQQDFEDTTGVDLQITATPAVPANEYVIVTVTGIPAGWSVTNMPAGSTFDSNTGTWEYRVPNGQTYTGGPSLVPPADGDCDATLNVSVSSYLSINDTLVDTTTATQSVIIDAVADNTDLTTNDYNTNQGSNVAISLGAALQDTDGSETITQVRITGLPTGFSVSPGTVDPNQADAYIVNVNDLANLTVTPEPSYTGIVNLTLEVINEETTLCGAELTTANNENTNTQQFTITYAAVPPTAIVTVPATAVEIFEDNEDWDNTGNHIGVVPLEATVSNGSGNETMTVTISGVPSTWTVTGGGLTLQGNGDYEVTLPVGQNFDEDVTFTVPANSDVDLSSVVVTASIVDPDFPATTTNPITANDDFSIVVDAVIDPLSLNAITPGGQAGTAIPLTIDVSTPDTDGSETIGNVVISGVPAGWTLSAGTLQLGGDWVLTTAELAGLTVTPDANAGAQTVTLTIDTSSTENPTTDQEIRTDNNSTTAQTTVDLTITAAPVPPTVTNTSPGTIAQNTAAEIFEDNQDWDNTGLRTGNIPLTATVNGGSGNEVLTVTLTGVPSTWTVTGGGLTLQVGGDYTVTLPAGQDFNATVLFTVPADSDVDLTGIQMISSVSDPDFPGTTISDTNEFDIIVDAVIDPLSLNATNTSGNAGAAIPLTISVSTPDTDGSETIGNVVISGVPAGWTLSAGTLQGGGDWVLTTAQLVGLTLTPDANAANQTVTLTVDTSSTENPNPDAEITDVNDSTTAQTTLDVTVTAAPTVTNTSPGTIAQNTAAEIFEDNQDWDNTGLRTGNIPLTATVNGGSGNEVLTVTLTGVPSTWTVTGGGLTLQVGGDYTVTLPAGQDFNAVVNFQVPADSDIDLTGIQMISSVSDPDFPGTTISDTNEFDIIVDAVIDPLSLNATNTSGNAGAAIPLTISVSTPDTDGSETIGNVVISGVPAGWTLSAGTLQGGGDWVLTTAQLVGLTLTPDANAANQTVTLTVDTSSTENPNPDAEITDVNDSTTAQTTLDVTVTAAPTVTNTSPGTIAQNTAAEIFEDNQDWDNTGQRTGNIPLTATVNGGSGNEVLTVTLTGVPSTWTVTGGGLTLQVGGDYTVTLPAGQDFNAVVNFQVPADSDIDLTGIQMISSVSDPDFPGTTISDTNEFDIIVDAVIDPLSLNAVDVSGAAGSSIPLNISASTPDTDGSETIGDVTISGIPAGWALSAGTLQGGGDWVLTTAQLVGLTVTPDAGAGNQTVTLTISTSATENPNPDAEITDANDTTTAQTTMDLTVTTVPTVTNTSPGTIGNNANAVIFEDNQDWDNTGLRTGNIPLTATVNGGSGNEVLTVTLTGVPSTWTVTGGGLTLLGNGDYTVTLPAGQDFNATVLFTVPADSDVDLTGIQMISSVSDPDFPGTTISDTNEFDIVVDAVVDEPNLQVSNASGSDNNPVGLSITTSPSDTDGSETITKVEISGIPTGFTLSAGTPVGSGTYELTTAELAGLELVPPSGYDGTITLTVTTYVSEAQIDNEYTLVNNDTTRTATLQVTITDADPTFTNVPVSLAREGDLSGGTETVTGNMTADFGDDGPGTFCVPTNGTFTSTGSMTNNTLSSGGVPVTVTSNGNVYTGVAGATTVFTMTVNADGSFTFNLFEPLDHSDTSSNSELINLNFQVCAEDNDGDVTTSTLTVQVQDSGPTAVNDVAYFATCDQIAHGNVLSGFNGYSGNNPANHDDTVSQDATWISSVSGNTFGGSGAMAVEGNYGTLYMFANGSYVYVQHTNVGNARTDTFSYTLTDADGDTSTATLTVQGIASNTSFNPWKEVISGSYTGTGNSEYILGSSGTNTLNGAGGDDFIAAGSGNDTVYGGDGNDVIWGELGADTLWGGAGSDIFTAATNDLLNNVVDTIMDFNAAEGDVLDLRHVLDHNVYNPNSPDLNNFVRAVNTGSGTMIQVNPDGTGSTYGWMDAVFIEGQQNMDVNQLFSNGNIEMI